jgi:hypothetical protein
MDTVPRLIALSVATSLTACLVLCNNVMASWGAVACNCIRTPAVGIVDPRAYLRYDDRALVRFVRNAYRNQLTPHQVKSQSLWCPTINTTSEADRVAFLNGNVVVDEIEPAAINIRYAHALIMWLRPGVEPGDRMVGLAWDDGGRISLFLGHVSFP